MSTPMWYFASGLKPSQLRVFTIEECPSCKRKMRREFKAGDYIVGTGETCEECHVPRVITMIYGEEAPRSEKKGRKARQPQLRVAERLLQTCDANGSMYSVVLVTCPADSADKIAEEVLKQRLAACVNVLGGVHSRFWWKGRLDSTDEGPLLIKTWAELLGRLERAVRQVHPYGVPEILKIRVEGASRPYLDWIAEETASMARKTTNH